MPAAPTTSTGLRSGADGGDDQLQHGPGNPRSPPVEATIDRPVPTDVLEELLGEFPDFQRGWAETGLSPAEFEGLEAFQHFRDTFVAAWDSLLMTIREARAGAQAR